MPPPAEEDAGAVNNPSRSWGIVGHRTADPRTLQVMTYVAPELNAGDVAHVLGARMSVDLEGAADTPICGVTTWAAAVAGSLSYQVLDEKNSAGTIVERTVLCNQHTRDCAGATAKIVVSDPRAAFMHFLRHLLDEGAIDMRKTVATQAQSVEPGEFEAHPSAIIEQPSIIADGVTLGAHVVVNPGSIIGRGVSIGTGVVIGEAGRALHKSTDACVLSWRKLHVGTTYIGESCEIGAHTVVNRAMLGQTRIGTHAQIGNLVHIGHGVRTGDRVWLGSHSAILGHVSLGDRATVGAHAVIRDNVDVGANAAIAMGSVVVSSVGADESVLGNPAKPVGRRLQPGPER